MRQLILLFLSFICLDCMAGDKPGQKLGDTTKIAKIIKRADVERIIKTLSTDDMQGRATFMPGIEKAAQFIESEFKSIGLKRLNGNTNYRQNFSMNKISSAKTRLSLNRKLIAPDSVFTITGINEFSWTNDCDVQIVKLNANMDFTKAYNTLVNNGKKQIVLVDQAFTAIFKRVWERNNRSKTAFKTISGAASVFVLGNFDNVQSFSVNYRSDQKEMPLFNILGLIPGKSTKKEYVIFSGHFDHLGILKPVEGDSIANGADDDASGITAMIELARYFKKINNNSRNLVFVAFTAEELGELGSQYFATQVDPDKIVAMFNIEMIGKPSKFGQNTAFITGFERSDFGTILQRNLAGSKFSFYPDPYLQQNLFYRSDNASLAKLGVPAHTISTDQIDIDPYYHTVKDELSTLDVSNITSTIRAIALSSQTIVAGTDTPKRIDKALR